MRLQFGFYMLLNTFFQDGIRLVSFFENDLGLYDLASDFVGNSDHPDQFYSRMFH